MNKELVEAIDLLEREKEISRETLFEAIESSLLIACRNNFGKSDNIHITMDRDTCEYEVYAEKTVVEEVLDKSLEISLEEAKKIDPEAEIGSTVKIDINSDMNTAGSLPRTQRMPSFRRSGRRREIPYMTDFRVLQGMWSPA